jgi:hypothetical protein
VSEVRVVSSAAEKSSVFQKNRNKFGPMKILHVDSLIRPTRHFDVLKNVNMPSGKKEKVDPNLESN